MSRYALVFSQLMLMGALSLSQAQTVDLLWPKGAPGALDGTDAAKPSLTHFPPSTEKANGSAVVVLPGGGYSGLATEKEGNQVARWLNTLGVYAFVLKYRVAPYKHPIEMNDAQRAMRWVRANAKRLKIDTSRVGILGFSAGGHLASTVATHYDNGNALAADTIDRFSCKPTIQILGYPVISFLSSPHIGSRDNLLGTNPSQALLELLSNERQVDANTPPAFLVHGKDDAIVLVANSQMYYDACIKAGVPAQLKLYDHGPHGFGLADGVAGAPKDALLATWPGICATWLQDQGFLTAATGLSGNELAPKVVAPAYSAKRLSNHDFLGRLRRLIHRSR